MPLIIGLMWITCGIGFISGGAHMILNRKKNEQERQEDREMRARELVALETRNELEIQRNAGARSIRRNPKQQPKVVPDGNEEESSGNQNPEG